LENLLSALQVSVNGNNHAYSLFHYTAIKSSESRLTEIVICGAVGGLVVMVMIIACIVVVFVRRSHNKSVINRANAEPNARTADVTLPNPGYGAVKSLKSDGEVYDYIRNDEVVLNQSYERCRSIDSFNITIQTNPSYGSSNNQNRISDVYGYVEPDKFIENPLPFPAIDYVNMEDNPSYGMTSREGSDNASYNTSQSE